MCYIHFLASTNNCTHDNCNLRATNKSSSIICSYPNKTCDNGTACISVEMLCNGKNDCLDNSDEGGQCGKWEYIIYNIMINLFYYVNWHSKSSGTDAVNQKPRLKGKNCYFNFQYTSLK